MPASLSVGEAVRLALQNNNRIRDALDAIEEAKIARRTAQAEFRPKFVPNVLGALAGSNSTNESYRLDLFQRFTTGAEIHATVGAASSRNQLGTFYYSDTTVSLSQPLLGRHGTDLLRRNLDGTQRRIDNAVAGHGEAQRQLALEVAAAYYEIVAHKQMFDVAAKSLERARKLLEVTDAKLTIGKVSQLDVLRSRQLVREAERQLLDARAQEEEAGDQLRLLTGVDTTGLILDSRPGLGPEVPAPGEALAIAMERRADVRAARDALADAEKVAAAMGRRALPRIDFKLALSRHETAGTLRSSFGVGGFRVIPFLALSMPVDRSPAARESLALDVQRKRRELEASRMNVEMDVRRAVRQHARLGHSLESARAGVAFAEMQLEIAHVRFERGLTNNLELISAETDLMAAEARKIAVLANLAIARLKLKHTLGTLNLAEDFEG